MRRVTRRICLFLVLVLLSFALVYQCSKHSLSSETVERDEYENDEYVYRDDVRTDYHPLDDSQITKIEDKGDRIEKFRFNELFPHNAQGPLKPNEEDHNEETRPNVRIFTGQPRLNITTKCVPLKYAKGNHSICTHDRNVDRMISSFVQDYGSWESDFMEDLASVLTSNPDLEFIDLGCNIGVFSILAASFGNKVVAVDPLLSNLELISESIRINNLKNITTVLNALSDRRGSVSMEIVDGNIGGSYIRASRPNDTYKVDAILLDDVIPITNRGKAFVKLDIEGNEHVTLKATSKFFQEIDVRYLRMEWMLVSGKKEGREMVDILVRHGMLPYEDIHRKKMLLPELQYSWPDNVYWIKRHIQESESMRTGLEKSSNE